MTPSATAGASALPDVAAIARVIEDGRRRRVSSASIADEVASLVFSPAWGKAMGHPMRAAIMRMFGDQPELSPVQASEELDGTLATVAYHFRVLRGLGLIEVCAQHRRRGAIEHMYRLCTPARAGNGALPKRPRRADPED